MRWPTRVPTTILSPKCANKARASKRSGWSPLQDPEAAVAEANRAVTKLGLSSIAVATQGMKEHLGSKTFWPLYEEMQRLNVPLCVHNRREGPGG